MRHSSRHFSTVFVVLFMSLALAACGFHLRGQLPLPASISVIYLDAEQTDFTLDLSKSLRSSGAELVDNPTQAKALLQIADEFAEREVLTLNTDGRATSFRLFYTVNYRVANVKQELLKEGTLTEQRTYNLDPGQGTLQEVEENELLEEMYKELALKMVRQLGAL